MRGSGKSTGCSRLGAAIIYLAHWIPCSRSEAFFPPRFLSF
uniref:Uncharacterized protein n=1 Tax=Arundo donax TaxID=35708 RepID=A0A0A9AX66_ARUDO